MLFADFEATARFFPTEEAFGTPSLLETFITIPFAETARFFEDEEAFFAPLVFEDILFLLLFFEFGRGTSFTSTNVKLRLRFDVYLTFH